MATSCSGSCGNSRCQAAWTSIAKANNQALKRHRAQAATGREDSEVVEDSEVIEDSEALRGGGADEQPGQSEGQSEGQQPEQPEQSPQGRKRARQKKRKASASGAKRKPTQRPSKPIEREPTDGTKRIANAAAIPVVATATAATGADTYRCAARESLPLVPPPYVPSPPCHVCRVPCDSSAEKWLPYSEKKRRDFVYIHCIVVYTNQRRLDGLAPLKGTRTPGPRRQKGPDPSAKLARTLDPRPRPGPRTTRRFWALGRSRRRLTAVPSVFLCSTRLSKFSPSKPFIKINL